MKKLILAFIALTLTLTVSIAGNSESLNIKINDQIVAPGFSYKFHFGFPGTLYGSTKAIEGVKVDYSDDVKSELKKARPGVTFGFEFGNQWYFGTNATETFGFGIILNYFDISYGARTYQNVKYTYVNFGLAEIGPMGTVEVGEDMGVDIYYQLRPTVLSRFEKGPDVDDSDVSLGLGHNLGAGFRYSVFYGGLEYHFGSTVINHTDYIESTDTHVDQKHKISTNNFRVILGFKF